jgi:hypothetical protein
MVFKQPGVLIDVWLTGNKENQNYQTFAVFFTIRLALDNNTNTIHPITSSKIFAASRSVPSFLLPHDPAYHPDHHFRFLHNDQFPLISVFKNAQSQDT